MQLLKREELEKEGYEFEVSHQQYMVRFKGEFVEGAGTLQPAKHWQHRKKNYQDNMASAMRIAMKHRTNYLTNTGQSVE